MESLRILRIWAAIAWADGVLHPREAAALRRLIDASDDLAEDEREEATRLLAGPSPLDPDELRRLTPVAREGVYRAALGIVRLDGRIADEERAMLGRIRAALDLDETIIRGIERERS